MRKPKLLAIAVAALCLTAGPVLAKIIIVQGLGFFCSVDANGNLDPKLPPGGLSGTVLFNTVTGDEIWHLSGQVTNLSNVSQIYIDNPNTFFNPFPPNDTVLLSVYKVAANGDASLLAHLHIAPPP